MAIELDTGATARELTEAATRHMLPQPCLLVIFGGAGDLSWRKLLPAVYNLNVDGVLPSHFAVVGFGLPAEGTVKGDPDEYIRNRARDGINRFSRQALDESHWADFARALFFVHGSFNDARAYAAAQGQARSRRSAVRHPRQPRLLPGRAAAVWSTCASPHLKDAGLVNDPDERRPPSRASSSRSRSAATWTAPARSSRTVGQAFAESQTYRIDHYLGKETVQNLLVLRFANSIFEPLWNEKYIDHVQITVAEEEGLAQYDPRHRRDDRHAGPATTRASAPCATWCRTTCCRCCAWWPWSRPGRWSRTWSATPRSACSTACGR